ncbi:MAG: tripartite tricarboxylate transporter substrate-binding protein [Burkholderiaceae bacterium]
MVDLLGNQIDMVVDQLSSSATQLKSGKLKALAVMTAHRVPTLPDVPTLEESGIKGLDLSTVTGLLVPVNTPTPVVDVLNKALQKAATDASVQRILSTLGSTAKASNPEEFMTLIRNEDVTAGELNAEGKLRTN